MNGGKTGNPEAVRSLVVVFSYHHDNTRKIARALARVLGADLRTPSEVGPDEIAEYDLVGFGSGIYHATFDPSMLDLVDRLPPSPGKMAFLFSTCGAPAFAVSREFVAKNHSQIRERLQAKGYRVIGEFGCPGWNTNGPLRFIGGLNRGRPDENDLGNAEAFAREMMEKARG
ncbi:MAG TPA: flavodoxin family protein [Methanoregulaceae archaeon]|nr:flavodoxin family protein [Methanoregulaceae archaeon]